MLDSIHSHRLSFVRARMQDLFWAQWRGLGTLPHPVFCGGHAPGFSQILYLCLPTANGVTFLISECRRINGCAVPALHLHGEAGVHWVQALLLPTSSQPSALWEACHQSQLLGPVGSRLVLFFILVALCLPLISWSTFPFFQDLGRERGPISKRY